MSSDESSLERSFFNSKTLSFTKSVWDSFDNRKFFKLSWYNSYFPLSVELNQFEWLVTNDFVSASLIPDIEAIKLIDIGRRNIAQRAKFFKNALRFAVEIPCGNAPS